jgi:hypothetical protein
MKVDCLVMKQMQRDRWIDRNYRLGISQGKEMRFDQSLENIRRLRIAATHQLKLISSFVTVRVNYMQ